MAVPEGLSATPFSPRYADRVEEWIDVYGNAVPLAIGHPAKEYEAIRTAVGASEYSMLYKWHIEGEAAVATVDAVFSRSVGGLGAGRIAYGVVVDDDGMMVDDVTVAVLAPDTPYWSSSTRPRTPTGSTPPTWADSCWACRGRCPAPRAASSTC